MSWRKWSVYAIKSRGCKFADGEFMWRISNIISETNLMTVSHWWHKTITWFLKRTMPLDADSTVPEIQCHLGNAPGAPSTNIVHDDVIKWKHFPRNWPFVRRIHRSPVNSPHKGQWRGALMFSLICVGINDWVNNREAGDLRRNRAHYDVTVMLSLHEERITSTI